MAAGQGEQQGHPGGGSQEQPQGGPPPAWPTAPHQQPGQPPAGWTPPGQPPAGWTPPGQPQPGQPPYGQNPYAFPNAPAAAPGWGAGVPQPLERPVTVRAGVGAFLAALVLSLIGSIVTVASWDEYLDWTLADAGTGLDDAALEGVDVERVAELTLQVGVAFTVVMLLVQAVVVWFAWRGYNWARIVLWVLGGITLLAAPFSTVSSGPVPFVTALSWFQVLLALAGVVLLAAKPSNDWYRFRKWQRVTGQG